MSTPASSASEPTLTISQDQTSLTIIERFNLPAGQQADAVQRAADHIAQVWKRQPGFVGAMLLRGRNHGGIVGYSQWAPPAGDTLPTAPDATQSLAAALGGPTPVDARTYTVAFVAHAESAPTPLQVSLSQTPFAHFGIFRVALGDQERLMEQVREHASSSLVTPGLLGIHFHQSIDGLQVINLGLWTTFDHMQSLLQRPGFRDDNVYWAGIAEFQPDFFDVIAVGAV